MLLVVCCHINYSETTKYKFSSIEQLYAKQYNCMYFIFNSNRCYYNLAKIKQIGVKSGSWNLYLNYIFSFKHYHLWIVLINFFKLSVGHNHAPWLYATTKSCDGSDRYREVRETTEEYGNEYSEWVRPRQRIGCV